MADNTAQNGAATIAADDVTTLNGSASSGVLVQRVKPAFGDDGTARDVSLLYPLPSVAPPSLHATQTSATSTISTLTLAAPGAGLFHYITKVQYQRFQVTAGTASGTVTMTGGTNHTMQWYLPNDNAAIGTVSTPVDFTPGTPLKVTTANTATTFTSPVITGAQYKIIVTYYIAP